MSTPSPLRIGVLILPPIQLLDITPVDLFGMLTPEYLSAIPLPAPLKAGAIPIHIIYISPLGAGTQVTCTAEAKLRIDAGLDDPEVAPGKLEILLIPGPDPREETGEKAKAFIRGHLEEGGATLMTVCTGCIPVGRAGVFKGRKATGPRGLLGDLKKDFPTTQWVDRRWVRDGKIWSSGGISNGQDMVAAYVRERWPGPTVEAILAMADVGDRGVEYGTGQAVDNMWWLWQTFRGWMRSKNH